MLLNFKPSSISGLCQKVEQLTVPHYLLDYLYSTKPHHQTEAQYVESLLLDYISKHSVNDLFKDHGKYGFEIADLCDAVRDTHTYKSFGGSVFGFLRNVYIPIVFFDYMIQLIPGGKTMDSHDLYIYIGSYVNSVIAHYERNHFKNFE